MAEFSPEFIAHVKAHEGFRSRPYLDFAGVPTVGYGHVVSSLRFPPVSEATASELLVKDLRIAHTLALGLWPNLVGHPRRLEAMTDMVFNLGSGKLRRSRLAWRIKEENWELAATEMLRWVYAKRPDGQYAKLPGLVKRREVTSTWMREG